MKATTKAFGLIAILLSIIIISVVRDWNHSEYVERVETPARQAKKLSSNEENDRTAPANYSTVSRVIDGDTIGIDTGAKVRYIGVDTPETKHPRKGVEFYGKEAFSFNKQLVGGRRVRLECDVQKRDRYGRLLAYVYLPDGTFVNAELVRKGYARVSTYPPNVKYQELFLRLEQQARQKKRGLWNQ